MIELVKKKVIKGVPTPVVSSRVLAENFGKQHKNVLQNIDNHFKVDGLKSQLVEIFIESTYKDSKGEKRKEYLMTEEGYSLIANKFTGAKALA